VTGSRAVEALLEGLVDYAGLFPPAALPMRDAVARYGSYRRGPNRRMLGRFVVPAARLDELAMAVPAATSGAAEDPSPWTLSALASANDAEFVDRFNASHEGRLVVDTVEAKADDAATINAIADAFGAQYAVFVEVDVRRDPAPLVEAIGKAGLRAKVRTGGVTAEAFPSGAEVLRFLEVCVGKRVPFKATAGLHHPVRGEFALTYAADSPRATMHGFLNLFLAALLLREGVPGREVAPLLDERDGAAIIALPDGLRWHTHAVTTAQVVAARRAFAGSFGSCSFEEPVQDLARLALI
jgi:hypothetical protein